MYRHQLRDRAIPIGRISGLHNPPQGTPFGGALWWPVIRAFYDTINNSLHFQLDLPLLLALGDSPAWWLSTCNALPPMAFIARDLHNAAALYTHHQYIAIFLDGRAFAHGAILLHPVITTPKPTRNNVWLGCLGTKKAIHQPP